MPAPGGRGRKLVRHPRVRRRRVGRAQAGAAPAPRDASFTCKSQEVGRSVTISGSLRMNLRCYERSNQRQPRGPIGRVLHPRGGEPGAEAARAPRAATDAGGGGRECDRMGWRRQAPSGAAARPRHPRPRPRGDRAQPVSDRGGDVQTSLRVAARMRSQPCGAGSAGARTRSPVAASPLGGSGSRPC